MYRQFVKQATRVVSNYTSSKIPTSMTPQTMISTRTMMNNTYKKQYKKAAAFTTTTTTLAIGAGVASSTDNKASCPYKFGVTTDVAKAKELEPKLRKAIEDIMEDDDYDGYGHYGPVFIRLSWHSAGNFDQRDGSAGSNGACMRFEPESSHGANAGLAIARERLEQIHKLFPEISYADLYTYVGKVAAEMMGSNTIPFRFGRSDYVENEHYKVPNVRLPDATQGAEHVRTVFTTQMGFTDQEIVALLGAHAVGKMHLDRSGFSSSIEKGLALPWTYAPTTMSNHYYTTLLEEKWTPIKNPHNNDVIQYENEKRDLIMLPAEIIFLTDPKFRPYVDLYAKDEAKWQEDFAQAFGKLLELGVPFKN